jgi:hypothetical protein
MKGIYKTVSDMQINDEMLKDASRRLKIKPCRIVSLSDIQNFCFFPSGEKYQR